MRHTEMQFLSGTQSPWVYVGVGEPERVESHLMYFYALPGTDSFVRQLRGWKMRTVAGCMDEFSAALQFPPVFGENWYALEEFLWYLDEWFPAERYVLVVERAEELLAEDPQSLSTFFTVANSVGEFWSKPVTSPEQFVRPERPFHILLNVTKGNEEAVAELIRIAHDAGVPVHADY